MPLHEPLQSPDHALLNKEKDILQDFFGPSCRSIGKDVRLVESYKQGAVSLQLKFLHPLCGDDLKGDTDIPEDLSILEIVATIKYAQRGIYKRATNQRRAISDDGINIEPLVLIRVVEAVQGCKRLIPSTVGLKGIDGRYRVFGDAPEALPLDGFFVLGGRVSDRKLVAGGRSARKRPDEMVKGRSQVEEHIATDSTDCGGGLRGDADSEHGLLQIEIYLRGNGAMTFVRGLKNGQKLVEILARPLELVSCPGERGVFGNVDHSGRIPAVAPAKWLSVNQVRAQIGQTDPDAEAKAIRFFQQRTKENIERGIRPAGKRFSLHSGEGA